MGEQQNSFTRVAGLAPTNAKGTAGFAGCWAVNKSGAALTAGMVLVLDPTAANHGAGKVLPVKTTTTAHDPKVCGAVPAGASTIPDGAKFFLQHTGLHTALKVDGTTDLANGDPVDTFTTAGVAAKGSDSSAAGVRARLGVYCDDAYATDATTAAKKVWLTNPLGLPSE